MALTVGELTATLTLDSAQFSAGLTAAQAQMASASAQFDVDLRPALDRAVSAAAAAMPAAGTTIAHALASGITSGSPAVTAAGAGLAQAAKTGAAQLSTLGAALGAQFAQGVANGINQNTAVIRAAAFKAANAAAAAAKAALGIASPSKVGAYIGQMFDRGIIKGMNDGAAAVASTARNMVGGLSAHTTYSGTSSLSAAIDYERMAGAIGEAVAQELVARPAYFEINDTRFAAASLDANQRVLSARERKVALGYGRI